jgi:hypothetical protein
MHKGAKMTFADYPLWLVFIFSLVVILAASESGIWLSKTASRSGKESISTVEAAILGILGRVDKIY